MKTNKFTSLAAVVCASGLALTGCGSGEGIQSSTSTNGKVEISVLAYQSEATMKPIVEAFTEANPDITVTLANRGNGTGGDYANTLQTRIAGNQTPDVFQIVSENRSDIIKNEIALDLAGQPILDTVDATWLDLYRSGEKVYAATFTAWMGGIIYNKDLIAEVGYTEFPETWDEFIKLGEALKANGTSPYYEEQQIASGSLTALLASNFEAEGIASADWALDGKVADQSFAQAWTPALEEWQKAVDAGVLPQETIGLDGEQIKAAFLNGEVAMFRSGNWHKAEVEEAGINYGFAAFPAFPGGKTYINGGGDPGYAVAANTSEEKQAAALKFIEFLGSEEGVRLLCEGQGAMSISSVYSSDPGESFKDAYENNLMTGQTYWIEWDKNSSSMVSTMTAQQQLMLQGSSTTDQFAEAMDAAFNVN